MPCMYCAKPITNYRQFCDILCKYQYQFGWSNEELREAVSKSKTYADVVRYLTGNCAKLQYTRVRKHIKRLSLLAEQNPEDNGGIYLDISKLVGKSARKGTRFTSIDDLLASSTTRSSTLRVRLIEAGCKEAKCERCFLSSWRSGPIPLELHHIDGNNRNNALSNLELLCCNCHAQTSTWRRSKSSIHADVA